MAVSSSFVAVATLSTRRHAIVIQRLAIAGMLAATSFVVFQINIPFTYDVHVNLAPLIGILTGSGIGSLIIFIINFLGATVFQRMGSGRC